ncbi:forkhead box protein N3 [Anabrus simplex]|uniref:forkhead box protein N3 n=1 Tax=Anabrus simplex TaxID=316456 RepID=UPI0035A385A4
MGRSCCVPGCKSNYGNASHVTIFKFPKDKTLREIWLRNIHREDFDINNKTVVCVKHFEPKFVVREDLFPTEYGEPVRVSRKNPKLTSDAIPTIFPDAPFCVRRERVKKVISTEERNLTKLCDGEGDIIPNSDDFKDVETPTSDCVDHNASRPADSTPPRGPSLNPARSQPPSNLRHPQHMPYDPLVHVNSIPPFSFTCLNFMAIEDSPNRALSVKGIYDWILQHFPYFKNAPAGWKNSVRHKLSINKCFRKVEKAPNLGKGCLWMVDSTYRPNLLQALEKSPFYPFRSMERVSMATERVHVPSLLNPLNCNDLEANSLLPNPQLFPLLSRCLAASCGTITDDTYSPDDGDAATAMLALKDEPRKPEWYKRPEDEENPLDMRRAKKRMRTSRNTQDCDSEHWIPVITTSPGEDHTYSASRMVLPTLYLDKAYEGPKQLVVNGVKPSLLFDSAEEQRKIAEGAAALLKLAGIATPKKSRSSEFQTAPSEIASKTPTSRAPLRGRRRRKGGVGLRPRCLRSIRLVKKSRCCQLECR